MARRPFLARGRRPHRRPVRRRLAPDDTGEHPGRHARAIERDAPSIATARNVSGEIGRWLARAGILDPD